METSLERAVQVFVQGFSSVRSATYPYPASLHDKLTVLRDAPPRNRGRKTEVVVQGIPPDRVVRAAAKHAPEWHFLCDIIGPDDDLKAKKAAYRQLGYRTVATEQVFAHTFQRIPHPTHRESIRVIRTTDELRACPCRRSLSRRFANGWTRFTLVQNDTDVGSVALVPTESGSWVSDLYVWPEFRRNGYAQALMSALLHECKAQGLGPSVLTASHTGARLYPKLGYEPLGTLIAMCPLKNTVNT